VRWSLLILAGLGGLLLGGPEVAAAASVIADTAIRLTPILRPRP
jgi:hypothetical protein